MSIYDLPQSLESINGGADRYNVDQLFPISGNINGAALGTGQASGLATFQWQDSNLWWSPCLSYFRMRVKFVRYAITGAPNSTDSTPQLNEWVAYADNFVSAMFSQIKSQINSRQLDIIDVPWVIDTVMSYANSKKTFLDSYASVSRLGEPFQTRLINTCSNGGVVEVCFRPPLALMQCKCLPPGAQFRLDFNWATNPAAVFESLGGDVTIGTSTSGSTNQYQVLIQDFSFFKATTAPSPLVQLPEHAVIDMNPAIVNQYFGQTGSLKQNITMPSTTNTIYMTIQDYNTAKINAAPGSGGPYASAQLGVGSGFNPITSFTNAVSSSLSTTIATANNCPLLNLYLTLPELGTQIPSPIYSFASGVEDWQRAFCDFINISQGTNGADQGGVSLGSYSLAQGCTIANAVFNAGNPNNSQQATVFNATIQPLGIATVAPVAATFNQTAKFGWLGRCPGPIFAFQVVRPQNKAVSTGNLNITFTGSPTNYVVNVICSYSMALQLQHVGGGLYSYNLVEGV